MSQMSVLTEVKMEEPNDYKEELKSELLPLDPNSNAYRLLNKEIERLEKGEPEGASSPQKTHPWLELHHDKPQSIKIQIRIPVKEHPKFNFVGKLLGPKGVTLRRLQEETGTKMSILGRGSMRDKAKEEECRKEGGKFAHLNQDLHLMLECFAEAVEGYGRISHALSELKKFLVPDFNDEIRAEQFEQMGYMNNGDKPGPGRGGFGGRGAPRGRGGPGAGPPSGPPRGGMAVRGAPPRGAPRGGPPPRGAPRGGPSRGAMGGPGRGRGVPPPAPTPPAYEDYGTSTGYDDGYSNTGSYNNSGGYREATYDQGYDQSGTQYFDYGHGAATGSGSAYDYGDAGWSSTTAAKPERGRGKPAPFGQRPHPYGRGGY